MQSMLKRNQGCCFSSFDEENKKEEKGQEQCGGAFFVAKYHTTTPKAECFTHLPPDMLFPTQITV